MYSIDSMYTYDSIESKPIPYWVAHPLIGYIWEYPPGYFTAPFNSEVKKLDQWLHFIHTAVDTLADVSGNIIEINLL